MSRPEDLRNTKKLKRLQEISKELTTLIKEIESLILDEVIDCSIIQIGDRIVIENNHRGLQGCQGTVVGATKARFRVKLDDGKYIYRSKTNVKKIE
jgi:RNase P/RNase MRP subunit p29